MASDVRTGSSDLREKIIVTGLGRVVKETETQKEERFTLSLIVDPSSESLAVSI